MAQSPSSSHNRASSGSNVATAPVQHAANHTHDNASTLLARKHITHDLRAVDTMYSRKLQKKQAAAAAASAASSAAATMKTTAAASSTDNVHSPNSGGRRAGSPFATLPAGAGVPSRSGTPGIAGGGPEGDMAADGNGSFSSSSSTIGRPDSPSSNGGGGTHSVVLAAAARAAQASSERSERFFYSVVLASWPKMLSSRPSPTLIRMLERDGVPDKMRHKVWTEILRRRPAGKDASRNTLKALRLQHQQQQQQQTSVVSSSMSSDIQRMQAESSRNASNSSAARSPAGPNNEPLSPTALLAPSSPAAQAAGLLVHERCDFCRFGVLPDSGNGSDPAAAGGAAAGADATADGVPVPTDPASLLHACTCPSDAVLFASIVAPSAASLAATMELFVLARRAEALERAQALAQAQAKAEEEALMRAEALARALAQFDGGLLVPPPNNSNTSVSFSAAGVEEAAASNASAAAADSNHNNGTAGSNAAAAASAGSEGGGGGEEEDLGYVQGLSYLAEVLLRYLPVPLAVEGLLGLFDPPVSGVHVVSGSSAAAATTSGGGASGGAGGVASSSSASSSSGGGSNNSPVALVVPAGALGDSSGRGVGLVFGGLSFFVHFSRMDVGLISRRFALFDSVLSLNCPTLGSHLRERGLVPDVYLLEYLACMGSKQFPLEWVGQVWDLVLLHGEAVLFRLVAATLGLLQPILLKLDTSKLVRALREPMGLGVFVLLPTAANTAAPSVRSPTANGTAITRSLTPSGTEHSSSNNSTCNSSSGARAHVAKLPAPVLLAPHARAPIDDAHNSAISTPLDTPSPSASVSLFAAAESIGRNIASSSPSPALQRAARGGRDGSSGDHHHHQHIRDDDVVSLTLTVESDAATGEVTVSVGLSLAQASSSETADAAPPEQEAEDAARPLTPLAAPSRALEEAAETPTTATAAGTSSSARQPAAVQPLPPVPTAPALPPPASPQPQQQRQQADAIKTTTVGSSGGTGASGAASGGGGSWWNPFARSTPAATPTPAASGAAGATSSSNSSSGHGRGRSGGGQGQGRELQVSITLPQLLAAMAAIELPAAVEDFCRAHLHGGHGHGRSHSAHFSSSPSSRSRRDD
jgi:hypothetical protein